MTYENGDIKVEIDDELIFEYIRKKLYPEQVFDEDELIQWATDNHYKKEE